MATPAGGAGAGPSPGDLWDAASPPADAGAAGGDGAAAEFSSPPLQSLSANAVALPPSARSSKLRLSRRSDAPPPPSQVASLSGAQLSAAVALGLAVAPAPAAAQASAGAAAVLSPSLQRAQLAPPVQPAVFRALGGNGPLFEAHAALMPVLGSESDDDDAPNFDLGLDHMIAPPQAATHAPPPPPPPCAPLRSPTPSPPPRYSPPPSTAARRRPPRAPLLGDDDEEAPRRLPAAAGFGAALSESDTPLPVVLPPARGATARRASQRLSQRLSQGGPLPWERASQDSEPLPVVAGVFSNPRPQRPRLQQPAYVAPPLPPPPPPAHASDEDDEDDDDGFAIAPRRTLKRLRRASAPVVILSDSEDEPLAQQPRRDAGAARGNDSDGVEEVSDDGEDGSDAAGDDGDDEELAEDDADWDDAAGAAGGAGGAGGDEWETWDDGDELGGGAGGGGGDDDYDFGAGRDASEVEDDDDFRAPPSRAATAHAAPRSVGRAALQLAKPAAGAARWPEAVDDDDEVQIVEPPEEPWRARLPHLVTCAQIERAGFRIAGERVHIDYRRQFGGSSRVSTASGGAGGGSSARARNSGGGGGGAASRTPAQARWLTEDGKKVFKTADGRTLTGSKAYKEYQKQLGGGAGAGGSRARHDAP